MNNGRDIIEVRELRKIYRVGNVDVPARVYEHAVVCEYAHARLAQLAERQRHDLSIRRHAAELEPST